MDRSYKIVSGNSFEDLEIKVSELINVGYIPTGDIFSYKNELYQPVVRLPASFSPYYKTGPG